MQGTLLLKCTVFIIIHFLLRREGFMAVVVTSVDPYKYEELLGDCIPLGYMTPIYVNFAEGN